MEICWTNLKIFQCRNLKKQLIAFSRPFSYALQLGNKVDNKITHKKPNNLVYMKILKSEDKRVQHESKQ